MIEKLGIHYLERYERGPFHMLMCNNDDVEYLEKQRDEMLEALIAWVVYAERFCFTDTNGNNTFKIIEKATGKTWSEIKELI